MFVGAWILLRSVVFQNPEAKKPEPDIAIGPLYSGFP
jgi:hypothetical protein